MELSKPKTFFKRPLISFSSLSTLTAVAALILSIQLGKNQGTDTAGNAFGLSIDDAKKTLTLTTEEQKVVTTPAGREILKFFTGLEFSPELVENSFSLYMTLDYIANKLPGSVINYSKSNNGLTIEPTPNCITFYDNRGNIYRIQKDMEGNKVILLDSVDSSSRITLPYSAFKSAVITHSLSSFIVSLTKDSEITISNEDLRRLNYGELPDNYPDKEQYHLHKRVSFEWAGFPPSNINGYKTTGEISGRIIVEPMEPSTASNEKFAPQILSFKKDIPDILISTSGSLSDADLNDEAASFGQVES